MLSAVSKLDASQRPAGPAYPIRKGKGMCPSQNTYCLPVTCAGTGQTLLYLATVQSPYRYLLILYLSTNSELYTLCRPDHP